ncbi:MAG: hypothetical protein R3C16_07770 [Hyphomonadaceae bacterium]
MRQWRGPTRGADARARLTAAEDQALDRFVMHYERITKSMMDGCHEAGWVVQLDEARNVQSVERITS